MLRIIIIDDEKNTREVISAILKKHCKEVEIIASADSVKSGIQAVLQYKPDLLLLDIHLQDGTGFDILRKIEQEDNLRVIFITAHEEYAVKAFKFSALDYILKPINSAELVAAVSKAASAFERTEKLQMDAFRDNYSGKKESKKIVLRTLDSIYSVDVADILRCQADTYYTHFFLRSGQKIMVSSTLKEFDEMLSEYGFFRVHQSHLINLAYFSKYKKSEGGFAVLKDGTEVPVSTRKKELFLQAIAKL